MALLIPMTSPRTFTSGPPELPGLIAASVWMKSWMLRAELLGRSSTRPFALLIPERVTDGEHPLADARRLAVAEARRDEVLRVDLEHGDVGARVGADDLRG